MKIQFLGTAAAEGYPALFCKCENCQKAWAAGGRSIRSRSQALVDGTLLIDYPCDTFQHMVTHRIDLTEIQHCLITHSHDDHLYPADLHYLTLGFSHPGEDWQGFTVYGSEDVASLSDYAKTSDGKFRIKVVEPFVPFQAGEFTVTALKALHGTPHPYFYIISKGGRTLLYAHDTGLFPQETVDYLRQEKPHFDLASLDCTEGNREELPYNAHMCLGGDRQTREMLCEIGCADEKTIFVLNHFSHNGLNSVYDEISEIAGREGFVVSYDGLEISF